MLSLQICLIFKDITLACGAAHCVAKRNSEAVPHEAIVGQFYEITHGKPRNQVHAHTQRFVIYAHLHLHLDLYVILNRFEILL